MAIPLPNLGHGTLSGIARKGVMLLGVLAFGLLFPALAAWGGSTNLINWGPGLLLAGAACLLLLGKDRLALAGGALHTGGFLLLLGLLFVRARHSPDVSATANHSALLALVAAGFLIGKLAGTAKSRALFIGLSLVSMLNLFCTVMQMSRPEWNLIYPLRSGGFPSGLFAHYSYSAAFCLGTIGLLAIGLLQGTHLAESRFDRRRRLRARHHSAQSLAGREPGPRLHGRRCRRAPARTGVLELQVGRQHLAARHHANWPAPDFRQLLRPVDRPEHRT